MRVSLLDYHSDIQFAVTETGELSNLRLVDDIFTNPEFLESNVMYNEDVRRKYLIWQLIKNLVHRRIFTICKYLSCAQPRQQ